MMFCVDLEKELSYKTLLVCIRMTRLRILIQCLLVCAIYSTLYMWLKLYYRLKCECLKHVLLLYQS